MVNIGMRTSTTIEKSLSASSTLPLRPRVPADPGLRKQVLSHFA
jgi:hypothetical protein